MPIETPPQLRYDKGVDRWKHVGKGDEPQIEFDIKEPKKWIGKCPNDKAIPDDVKGLLLNEAIPGQLGDRNVNYVKTVFVVHKGAIYAAQTSDAGSTYHGYPYKGRLAGAVLDRLRAMAESKNCGKEFQKWVKSYILRHGERR